VIIAPALLPHLNHRQIVFFANTINLIGSFHCSNPNEQHKQEPVLAASRERNRFRSIVWDEYDSVHQKYLEIGKLGATLLLR
jgi:hypothetical protein